MKDMHFYLYNMHFVIVVQYKWKINFKIQPWLRSCGTPDYFQKFEHQNCTLIKTYENKIKTLLLGQLQLDCVHKHEVIQQTSLANSENGKVFNFTCQRLGGFQPMLRINVIKTPKRKEVTYIEIFQATIEIKTTCLCIIVPICFYFKSRISAGNTEYKVKKD